MRNKKKYTVKEHCVKPYDLISYKEKIFEFEDGDVIRIRYYSVFPPDNLETHSVMNLYGQTILNKYINYDEELL